MQTQRQSVIEAVANVLVGYSVALASQLVIFPWYGVYLSVGENAWIGVWFTVISFIRSYLLRRFYNWYHTSERNLCESQQNDQKSGTTVIQCVQKEIAQHTEPVNSRTTGTTILSGRV